MSLLTVLIPMLVRNEGRRVTPYFDSEGVPTVGVGFNLMAKSAAQDLRDAGVRNQAALTDEQVVFLLMRSIERAKTDARIAFATFDTLSVNRQAALTDMAFNLGLTRLAKFIKMRKAVQAGDFEKAAEEALDSKWARQVGARAERNADLLRKG